jgi:hypothetical protein
MRRIEATALLAAIVVPGTVGGQRSVPIRNLESPVAATPAGLVLSITGLRGLSTGGALVNDRLSRRVVLLDEHLRLVKVVADSSSMTGRLYGPYETALLPFGGDSSLFLSATNLSMAVLDGRGAVTRVMASPRPSDFGQLLSGAKGNPGVDAKGRLVYRAAGISMKDQIRLGELNRAPDPEFVPLVRFNLATRRLDTASTILIYTPRIVLLGRNAKRNDTSFTRTWLRTVLNPYPTVDDWAILSDGRLAIVRGRDYHVDFVDADSRITSGPKIDFPWRRLSDSDKVALLDSARVLRTRLESEPLGAASTRVVTGATPVQAGDTAPPGDLYVAPEELPDYQPAFAAGGVRADADGHLWVRTIPPTATAGGAIYDVIDGAGRLVDKVMVPRSAAIAGFAPNGVIFLARRDGKTLVLERVQHRLPAAPL